MDKKMSDPDGIIEAASVGVAHFNGGDFKLLYGVITRDFKGRFATPSPFRSSPIRCILGDYVETRNSVYRVSSWDRPHGDWKASLEHEDEIDAL